MASRRKREEEKSSSKENAREREREREKNGGEREKNGGERERERERATESTRGSLRERATKGRSANHWLPQLLQHGFGRKGTSVFSLSFF